MRLLVVEDEIKLADSLKRALTAESYAVDVANTGEDAVEQASVNTYDLLILDIGLPGLDGFGVAEQLRKDGILTPIIFLTARDAQADIIRGLDLGGDDYMVKPFDFEILLARVRAIWRRAASSSDAKNPILQVADVRLDPAQQTVFRGETSIAVSAKEYALIEFFLRHPNQVLSKSQLIEHVWDGDIDPFSNVVDVYIGYLRQKIDRAFAKLPPLLHTLRGRGYKFGREE